MSVTHDRHESRRMRFGWALPVAMAGQSALGLWRREWYVDDAWVKSTWVGNDGVTLFVIVPLLLAALPLARRGSRRARALWVGLVAYTVYNYAFYLLGAALNVFFPLYVALVLLSASLLIGALLDRRPRRDDFTGGILPRLCGAWLVFVGTGLGTVWLILGARHVFAAAPLPIAADAFRLVAALDLTMLTPALITAGVLLWKDTPWGFWSGAVASVGGAAYLLVLTVNSMLAWQGGNSAAGTELVLWGVLLMVTGTVAAILCASMRPRVEGAVS